jgi:putative transposase
VRANQAAYPVATMCRLLGVSTSGFYAWRDRAPSARAQADAQLLAHIREIHEHSRDTYGRPRVHAQLAEQGVRVSPKRVGRLMREARLHGVSRRKRIYTTVRDVNARPAPDLVQRCFAADGPDQLWVADISVLQ